MSESSSALSFDSPPHSSLSGSLPGLSLRTRLLGFRRKLLLVEYCYFSSCEDYPPPGPLFTQRASTRNDAGSAHSLSSLLLALFPSDPGFDVNGEGSGGGGGDARSHPHPRETHSQACSDATIKPPSHPLEKMMESTLQTQQGARVFRLHSTSSNTTSAISQGSSYTATNLAKQDSKVPHGIAVTMPGALLVCDVRAAIAPSELIGIKQTTTSATSSTTTTAPSPSPSPSSPPPSQSSSTPSAPPSSRFLRGLYDFAEKAAAAVVTKQPNATQTPSNRDSFEMTMDAVDCTTNATTATEQWEVIWKQGGPNAPIQSVGLVATPHVAAQLRDELEKQSLRETKLALEQQNWRETTMASSSQDKQEQERKHPPTHIALSNNHNGNSSTPRLASAAARETVDGRRPASAPAEAALLDMKSIHAISCALPPTRRHATWRLLYATHTHGFSLGSLYRAASKVAPVALVVQDCGGAIFGAYITEPLQISTRYYGTGETFVFRLTNDNDDSAYSWAGRHRDAGIATNELFVYGAADALTIGGGGRPALWLDGDLNCGASGDCETFASPSLSSSPEFQVKDVELYAVIA